jgi:hypothetical protein
LKYSGGKRAEGEEEGKSSLELSTNEMNDVSKYLTMESRSLCFRTGYHLLGAVYDLVNKQ